MASPSSSWRGSWKTTSDSALTVSSSSSSCSSSSFIFSLRQRNPRRTATHRTKLCLDNNNSSSSSSSLSSSSSSADEVVQISSTTTGKKILKSKLTQIGRRSVDPSSLLLGIEEFPNSKSKKISFEKKVKNDSSLNLKIRLKSLFGKRPLWKRILFASKKVRSIILLNVIAVVYASNIPVVKEVEAIMDPAAFTVVRFAIAAVPFLPFVFRARGDVQTRNAGIELGFWVSLGYLMQALGLLTSDAGRASFISLFTVIVVPLLDGMLGATIPARYWFGALMSILGVTLLESSGSPPSVGDLLNFFSAVFFGVHMLRTEHISRTTKKENFLPLLGYQVSVIAVFSTIWYFMGDWFDGTHGWDPGSWTFTMVLDWMVRFPWIPALYTGVFSTGICLWVEMAAMCDVSATETAVIYGLEPLWGAAFAWFLLGERWGVTGWIGAALVLGGSLAVQISGSSSPSKSIQDKDGGEKGDNLLVSDKRNGLSPSPIVVTSRKNASDLLKK